MFDGKTLVGIVVTITRASKSLFLTTLGLTSAADATNNAVWGPSLIGDRRPSCSRKMSNTTGISILSSDLDGKRQVASLGFLTLIKFKFLTYELGLQTPATE